MLQEQSAGDHLTLPYCVDPPEECRASMVSFNDACNKNNPVLALQLAPEQHPNALTKGLNYTIMRGHLELATKLLQIGAKWDSRTVELAVPTLNSVKWLVDSGFDINTGMMGGSVILSLAVWDNWNDEIVQYLLEQGADPNRGPIRARWHSGIGPTIPDSGAILDHVVSTGRIDRAALLISYGADVSNGVPLHWAAMGCDQSKCSGIPMMEYLVSLGADVNAFDDALSVRGGLGQKGTPLQYAIYHARFEEAKWLLEHGADPDKQTPWASNLSSLFAYTFEMQSNL
ncbi:ankyrin repeat-containing domain protein [Dendryphion nanum]|uniref:Ankyrin repeat-containing domain protein n=1 Tax=Dendryphion nanum TaxID=256645 RepID=A0A9P9D978_9PLEO|nr:ankyrin repeat-containing domain protein [Dendryphion nanum]